MNNLKQYREYLYMQELAESTIYLYLRIARKFLDFAGEKAVDKSDALAYKKHLEQSGLAVATINQQIIAVNRFLRFCGSGRCAVKTERIQRHGSIENVISEGDYLQMLIYTRKHGDDKYYSIMKTLALTGIRISELKYFKAENIGTGHITVNNKGKIREIYLPDSLITLLKGYCERHGITEGSIFLGSTGNPISRVAVWEKINKIAQKAGIDRDKGHPHSFRHYFALAYMKKYSNMFELADILGHASLETTRIYAAASVEEKRKRIQTLDMDEKSEQNTILCEVSQDFFQKKL